jgi:hypothetical protein
VDLDAIFTEVSKQMISDFTKTKSSLTHSGLKGEANEETVRKFLRQYLPKTLDITTGMLVDAKGNQSRQLDIIISDAAKTPIFYESGNLRVIPAECTYAVIEVKANLDAHELTKAYENMKSVKSLEKSSYFKTRGPIKESHSLYGKEWEFWPTHHFIFAYESNELGSIVQNLRGLQATDEVHQRIDCICVLNKGVILNQEADGSVSALPTPSSKAAACITTKALLLFYSLMSIILNQASMSPFNLKPYLGKMIF